MDLIQNDKLDYTEINRIAATIERLKSATPGKISAASIVKDLSELLSGYSPTMIELPNGGIASWYRVRKFDDDNVRVNHQEMSYPPANSQGRANHSGTPVLYAGNQVGTALAEIGASEGKWYQSARYALKHGSTATAIAIGELDYFERCKLSLLPWATEPLTKRLIKLDMAQRVCIYLVEAFIAEMFGRRDGAENDYVMTNAIVDMLFALCPSAGAILYPSVIRRGGLNIAIKSTCLDASFEYVEGSFGQIERDLGFGLFVVHRTHRVFRGGDRFMPNPTDGTGAHTA